MEPLAELSSVLDPATPGLWWARREPSPLVGSLAPAAGYPFALLEERGVEAVVSLLGPPSYDAGRLRSYSFRLQDLYGGTAPADPVAERAELTAAADQVAHLVADGVGVVVHCAAGIGRTSTVIGAVLVAQGHPRADVVAWLDAVQRARGAPGWPESAWQLEGLDALVDRN